MSEERAFYLGRIGGRTLTEENLRAIEEAMQKIEPIDQSEAFERYAEEVRGRLDRMERERKAFEEMRAWASERDKTKSP